jgi:hypothetical protein
LLANSGQARCEPGGFPKVTNDRWEQVVQKAKAATDAIVAATESCLGTANAEQHLANARSFLNAGVNSLHWSCEVMNIGFFEAAIAEANKAKAASATKKPS